MQLARQIELCFCVSFPSKRLVQSSQPPVWIWIVRSELNRLFEFCDCVFTAMGIDVQDAEINMRSLYVRIDADCFLSQRKCDFEFAEPNLESARYARA